MSLRRALFLIGPDESPQLALEALRTLSPAPEALVVRLQIELNPDGSVSGQPVVMNSSSAPFFRAASDSARRAVLRCQPYQLPAAKYDTWRQVIVNFDPREMFGG